MAISLARNFFESNQTNVRNVDSNLQKKILAPKNSARKSGLIVNDSKYDLLVWFGSKLPENDADWLVIPSRANSDIPLFFVGDIYGFWRGDDGRKAKIYEFYGD
jgi:hypothetical protein